MMNRPFLIFSKVLGLFCFLFLTQCGKVVGSGDHSTIDGANLVIDAPGNINLTNIGAYPVSGRCVVEGGDVNVSVGSPVVATQTFNCINERFSGTIDLSSVTIPSGTVELSASQTLLPISSGAKNANVDLSGAPPAPTVNTPAAGSFVNSVSQTFSGTCIASASLSFTGDIVGGPISATCSGGSAFSRTVTLTAANTNKTISVTQTAISGTSPAANITITLDTVNPTAPTILTPINASVVNVVTQTVSGICESGASVRITGAVVGSPVIASCSGGSYSQTINLTATQGSKTITVNQIDVAGNTSGNTNITITLDSVAPAAIVFTTPTNYSAVSSVSQTLTGNCEAGASIEITGDIVGQPLTVVCSGGGTFSRSITLESGDDTKNITAHQTDVAGNTSIDTNLELTLDTLNPVVPVITTPANASIVNTLAQTVTGDCEPDAVVHISGSITGSPVTATCSSGGSYTRAVTLTAAQGSKTITVQQNDLAGNLSPSASVTFTLDSIAPSAPTIVTPVNGSVVNNSAQTISGSCETGASVQITGSIVGSPVSVTCVAANYTQAITLSVGQGIKTFTVNQTDGGGNASSNATSSITYDTLAPTAPTFTNPVNGGTVTSTSQTLTGSCEAGATVEISGDVNSSPITVVCGSGGTYSIVATLTAAQGSKSLDVFQTDTAGNSSPNANTTFFLDSVAPTAPTIVSPVDGTNVNSTSQTVSGVCETGATVEITGAIVGSPVTEVCIGAAYSQVVNLTATQGSKAITVNQQDPAGNISPTTTVTITYDSIAPSAPTITAPANNSYVNLSAQTLSGNCEALATVEISGDIVGGPIDVACPGGGTYSQAITLTAAQGSKTITVHQEDAALNVSSNTSVTITYDSVVPSAPTITAPVNGSTLNSTTTTLTGACEAGADVQISGDIVGSPLTIVCGGGTYSQGITISGTDGSKTITVNQEDAAGNTSSNTSSTFTLDSDAPLAPTIATPVNGSYVAVEAQTVTGSCEAAATVYISGNFIGTPLSLVCSGGGTYSKGITLTATQGSKPIDVYQVDGGGNNSPITTSTITLDSEAPLIPTIATPANGSLVNSTSQNMTGACETGTTIRISGNIVGAPVTTTCVASSYSQAVTLSAGEGAKSIDVEQVDLAGNNSPIANTAITLDSVAPSAPTLTSPTNGDVVNLTAINIEGACETGATVQVTGDVVGVPLTAVCIGNAYSIVTNLTATQGSKIITANQVDPAGNTSSDVSATITLDSIAPSAPTIVTPVNASLVNTTAQTVSGACETGAEVEISGDIVGSPVTMTCSASAYSQAVTLTAAQGAKSIVVNQTDAASNVSGNSNVSVTHDSVAPSVPTIVTPVNASLVNATAQTVSGACETGAEVEISGDIVGSPVTTTCSASAYSQAVTLTAAQGAKSIVVNQTDAANNVSGNSNVSVTYDSVAPSAPTIVIPANASLVNTTAQTVSGACETGAEVEISGDIVGSPVTTTCSASAYSQAVTLTAAQGAKTISVEQTDASNNTSSNVSVTITLDSVPPSAPTIVTPANASLVNTTAQTVSGACETGAEVEISGDIVGSPVTTTCSASTYSQAVTLTAAQGAKSIDVEQTDVANNTSSSTNSTITLDSVAPSAPTITAPADASTVNVANQTLTGACEVDATLEISGDVVGSPVAATCSGGTYSQAITLTPAQGSKNIAATQTDLAGNESSATNITATLDTVAPAAPTITAPANGIYVGSTSQTIAGSCEVGATVEIAGDILSTPVTVACGGGGTYSQAITLTAAQGSKTITVHQEDIAGNISSDINTTITYDSVAPSAPTIVTPADGSILNSVSQTLTGSCEANATVEITGDVLSAPVTVTCTGGGNYSQAITLTAVQGAKTISVTQEDAAGNASSGVMSSVTLDTLAPSAPTIVTPADGARVNTTTVYIEGVCETGAIVSITGDIQSAPVTGTCVANAYSIEVSLTPSQTLKTLTVQQTDPAGNSSTNTNSTVTLDTTPPLAPTIVSPASGSYVNSTAQTISGACEALATVRITGDIVGSPVTTACSGGGAYSQAITLITGDDEKSINVEQIDVAGNTSPDVNTTITLDTLQPIAPTIVWPTNGVYLNNVSNTLTGVCEPAATLRISGDVDSSPLTIVCSVGGNYGTAINLTSSQGSKTIDVEQTDSAGNTSPSVSVTITYDSVPPAAPTIVTPANGSLVNTTTQTVTGACEDGATVVISGDITVPLVTVVCSVSNTYSQSITLTSSQGSKSIYVEQEDVATNVSSGVNISITLDTVAPLAPTITTPANGSLVNTTAQTVTGSCETGATVEITGDVDSSPISLTCVSSSYSQAVTLTSAQVSKTITVIQEDPSGNSSPDVNSTFTLDSEAPLAPTIVNPANGSYVNTTSRTVNGACEPGATVNISGDITPSPVTRVCTVGGTYSRAVTLTAAQGSKTITVEQVDAAGNTSTSVNTVITYDSIEPDEPTITAPIDGSFVNTTAQTVTGGCEVGASIEIFGNIVGAPVSTSCTGGGTYSRAVTLTPGDESKTINVNQVDLAGNISVTAYVEVTLDTVVPAAPTIATPANGGAVNNIAQTVTGDCEAGATVRLTGNIVGAPLTTICLVSDTYSRAVTLTAGEGSKTITAEQFDASGNTSSSVNSIFTFDTLPPATPTIVTPADASMVNLASQTVTGSCEDGSTVRITGDILTPPVTDICVSSSYSIVVTLSAGQGAKTITVNQVDPAGNTSSSVNSIITLDSIAPLAPTITAPTDGSYVSSTAETVTGACEAGTTVRINGDISGAPVTTTCLVGNTYSRVVTLTMTQGSKTITVDQVDAAGNISPDVEIFITLDSIEPSAPTISTPIHGSYVNTTAQTVTGDCEAGATVHVYGNISGGSTATICLVSNTYSVAVTLTSSQGSKSITVDQEDLAGNVSSSVNSTITLDTLTPSAPTLTTPTNGSLQGTVSQTATGSCEAGATVEISGDVVSAPVTITCGGSSYSVAITLTSTQGSKTVTATQVDLAGNTSSSVNSVFTLDTVAPSAPTIATPANGSYSDTTYLDVTGSCENGATLNITGNISGSPLTTTCSGGTYSLSVTLTATQGSKTITVNQVDLAGNPSPVINSTITLDTIAPTVVLASSLKPATSTSPITMTATFSEAVTGFVSSDLTVENGSVTGLTGGPTVYNISITPAAQGSVSVQIPDGVAQDAAGNSNAISNKREFVYLTTVASNMFISRWLIPANNTVVTLPLFDTSPNYNFTVNWGDGSPVGTVTSFDDVDRIHTYTTAGDYVVVIQGTANNWGYSTWATDHPCYIREVLQLGRLGWNRFTNGFRNCTNLVSFHSGEVSNQFQFAFNANNMFMDATNLEVINTNTWDMSFFINFNGMFRNAVKINPNVSSWDTSKVNDIRNMFNGATSANPNVSGWNTSLVTRMDGMFASATSANPDVSAWDTSAVINFNNMFNGASIANPNTTSWSFASMTSGTDMLLNSNISNSNYSTFLIRANATGPNSMAIGTIPAKYQPSAAAARTNLLGTKGWTFTDSGAE